MLPKNVVLFHENIRINVNDFNFYILNSVYFELMFTYRNNKLLCIQKLSQLTYRYQLG